MKRLITAMILVAMATMAGCSEGEAHYDKMHKHYYKKQVLSGGCILFEVVSFVSYPGGYLESTEGYFYTAAQADSALDVLNPKMTKSEWRDDALDSLVMDPKEWRK